jgi:hypothetical protein
MNQEMIDRAKMELVQSVLDTDRGSSALIEKRAIIKEAMVCCNAMQCNAKKHKLLFLFHMILVEEQLFFCLSTNSLAHSSGCIIHSRASHFVCRILQQFFF